MWVWQISQRIEIYYAKPLAASNKVMGLPVFGRGLPYHLPGVVDPESVAIVSTKRAEVGYFLAVRVSPIKYTGRAREMRTQ